MQTLHNHGPTRRQPSNSVHEQQQDDVYSDDYREYQSDQQQAYQQDQQDQQDHQHQSTGPSQRHCRIHHPRSGGSPESGIRIDQRTRSVSSNLWRTVHASIMPRRATWLSNFGSKSHPHERRRVSTFTLASGSRKKERRWPLVLRFWKGSVHVDIMFPILCLSLFSAAVVWAEKHISTSFYLPSSIIPSLSIVVGLELVFRNQTSYSRFWSGRLHLNTYTTAIRNISRQILVLVPAPAAPKAMPVSQDCDSACASGYATPVIGSTTPNGSVYHGIYGSTDEAPLDKEMEYKTLEVVKILIAMLYSVKNHLRADWGVSVAQGIQITGDGEVVTTEEYKDLLPQGMKGYEHRGLGLTLQLTTFVEDYINIGVQKAWFMNSAAGSMCSELNRLVGAYGDMEVIRLAPTPVAHLIHSKQTLAAYCCILPFAMAAEIGWWTIPVVAFVSFTFYGIEGIAQWHEDPFGKDKIDINMDDVVEDSRREIEVLLSMWRTQGQTKGGPFQPHSMLVASPVSMDKSGLAAQPDEAQLTYMSRESTMVEGISGNPPRRDRRGRGDSGASGKQVRAERSSGDTAERNPGGDIERGDYAPLLSRKRDGSEGGYGGT